MAKTYKILGALLSYPEQALIDALPELKAVMRQEALVGKKYLRDLDKLFDHLECGELIELQENYVNEFDRNLPLSLHLFEHVYGESRDRGQAMVDLHNLYQEHGLTIYQNELPDFLPLFLEFLSELPESDANDLLGDPINIIATLGGRLKKCKSPYAVIFSILEQLSSEKPNKTLVEKALEEKSKKASDEKAKIDEMWEEKPVQFMHPKQQTSKIFERT